MTKPQFSAEPSMEDILASIRKMISEERLGPRPIPDQIGRSPFGESISEPLTGGPGLETRSERTSAPAERPAPSFSSLSDALKAAAPAPEPRRTLEEKIADMLEGGDAPSSRPAPPDPLAVFAANRQSPVTSPDPTPFGVIPRNTTAPERYIDERRTAERSTPERTESGRAARSSPRPPEAPINGSGRRRDELAARSAAASVTPNGANGESADAQRIIAMPPPRNGAVNGARHQPGATNGAHATNGAANGAKVSPLGGLRPFPGEPNGSEHGITAKSSDGFAAKPGDGAARKVSDPFGDALAKSDPALRPDRTETRREEPKTPSTETGPFMARAPFDGPKPAETKSTDNSSTGSPQQPGGAPSDALVDAVVALVHKEPDTLSVFTSGSAFIHGVVQDDAHKPGPNMARKLDRSAAELLRPMLRQWLSDNMPRIVEEALRSELMNSEGAPKDPEKK